MAPDVATGVEHECQSGSACLLEPTGGFTDPVAAAEDLLRAARREGVDIRLNCEVLDVIQHAGHVTGLRLKGGETIATATLINASGPWCNRLIQSSGISFQWTLVPTRIQVMYLTRHDDVRLPLPVVADMGGGIYFRPQNNNQQIVVGSVLEADEREVIDDMDHFDRDTDQDFRVAKLHALHHRLPALPYRGTVRGYAGLYTINSQDAHPIVGPTELDGFLLANGFSGHGFKLAPAIGSLLAQFVTGTSAAFDTDVPITFLAKDRQPLVVDSKTALA
ncbi:MAG: FAD-dependent oxidoreductase [Gammaproteobacteria bacterium]|nr:FAD-dependent oxidoreductase [Gammaproteobacteria bacterium]